MDVDAVRVTHPTRQVPWAFLVPALLVCAGVLLVPSLIGAGYAFTAWDGLTPASWVGLDNFSEFLDEPAGKDVVEHTLLLALVYVLGVNALGLGLALGLQSTLRTRGVLRALFFLPAVMSPLVVAYVWKFILDANGPLNEGLEAVGLDGVAQAWLGKPDTALLAIAVVMIWQFSGYHMLIYLAGLQGVQQELQEAAAVDGASTWRRFRDITLPLLLPAITIGVAFSTITALTVFDQVMALTGGGPAGATDTLGTYVYKQAFANGRYGYSAAVALVLVAVVGLVAFVQLRALRRRAA
jgi:raffinose/stachyose/melibiose transport system permease protein